MLRGREHPCGAGLSGLWAKGSIGCLLIALAVSRCGGDTAVKPSSQEVQRNIAGRFATALLNGDIAGARALLLRPDEAALVFLVRQAAAPWKTQHASIQLPVRRTGNRWTVSYAGTRSHRDGRFETESGNLIVLVAPSTAGGRVRFFLFSHVHTRFSTHHDAQLLPSNR
jgi:hypothetical protein